MERDLGNTYPKVRFFHIEHGNDTLPALFDGLKDMDIVMLEQLGFQRHERGWANSSLEDLLRVNKNQADKELTLMFTAGSFSLRLAKEMVHSQKLLILIDIDQDNPIMDLSETSEDARKLAIDSFSKGNFHESYQHFSLFLRLQAKSILARDNYVANEISKLIKKNKFDWKGKKIGVVQGVGHSRTYRLFKSANPAVPSSRTYLQPFVLFGVEHEYRQRLDKADGKEILDTLSRKHFLETFIIYPAIKKTFDKFSLSDQLNITDQIVRSLNQDEINHIFEALEDLKLKTTDEGITSLRLIKPYILNIYTMLIAEKILEQKSEFISRHGRGRLHGYP